MGLRGIRLCGDTNISRTTPRQKAITLAMMTTAVLGKHFVPVTVFDADGEKLVKFVMLGPLRLMLAKRLSGLS